MRDGSDSQESGEFWMSFEDFDKIYETSVACMVKPNYHYSAITVE